MKKILVTYATMSGSTAEVAEAGIRNIWVQQGGESPDLVKLGEDLKLNLVTGKCILMYAQRVLGFHRIHRFVTRLSGQL